MIQISGPNHAGASSRTNQYLLVYLSSTSPFSCFYPAHFRDSDPMRISMRTMLAIGHLYLG
jgi:hypothetical protein